MSVNTRKLLSTFLSLFSISLVIPTWYLMDNGYFVAWFFLGTLVLVIHLLDNKIKEINLSLSMFFFAAFYIVLLGIFSALIVGVIGLLTLDSIDEGDQKVNLSLDDYIDLNIGQLN